MLRREGWRDRESLKALTGIPFPSCCLTANIPFPPTVTRRYHDAVAVPSKKRFPYPLACAGKLPACRARRTPPDSEEPVHGPAESAFVALTSLIVPLLLARRPTVRAQSGLSLDVNDHVILLKAVTAQRLDFHRGRFAVDLHLPLFTGHQIIVIQGHGFSVSVKPAPYVAIKPVLVT